MRRRDESENEVGMKGKGRRKERGMRGTEVTGRGDGR